VGGNVTLAGMTIRDGLADFDSPILAGIGRGILNFGSLTLSNDIVSMNALALVTSILKTHFECQRTVPQVTPFLQ
jgi:hypothetical protein